MTTLVEAKNEIPDIDIFCEAVCQYCTSNDWYCPDYCDVLEDRKSVV